MSSRADSKPGAVTDSPAPASRKGGGAPGAGAPAKKIRRTTRGRAPWWVALIWLGPALALIFGVVIYPAIELVRASTGEYSITGLRRGPAGIDNYSHVLSHPALGTVLLNTAIWVAAVVLITIVLSLGLAQFLSKEFFGRRLVRWAVLVPWAASLVITARLFTLIFDYYHGILNVFLLKLHVISEPIDWLGDDTWTMPSMILVGVLVSIPFTAYVLLAGLNSIPDDVHEAARIDGASAWQAYRQVTFPLLRPALLVSAVLNMIYVFNSFPIVWTLNDRNPGYTHDTTITFMYKLAFKSADRDVGASAAAGVFNVLLILVAVVLYLRLVKWREEES
ncbi:carbohydrate ABC transporter permease [Cryptosporangium arvum]|uniref:Carbohydrate ABC transporter membrane protein 1, CUT1 family n=1 Tax=Cryptosporangium arvum DSM 44712 TaxID=927661 RepID=A0A010YIJ0_9ACTN|nr:sugar ABC transporter permease [Cryptosporangium arvum]EXG80075.1 carbohydrate ABC transporter membrane protein 1, CUT1 family [Cryptosporangium arvum DSM 44712]